MEEQIIDFKSYKQVVMAAVKNEGSALEYASEALRADKEVVIAASENFRINYGCPLEYASEDLRSDKEVVMTYIKLWPANKRYFHHHPMQYPSIDLRADKEIVMLAVKIDGNSLKYASEELKSDNEVVMAAVKSHGGALYHASEELKSDKEVVMAAVKSHGGALYHASEELKSDKEVVMLAVQLDGALLRHASVELQADRELVMTAANNDRNALDPPSEELKSDKEVVMAAEKRKELDKKQDANFEFQTKKRKAETLLYNNPADREVVMLAVQLDGILLRHASEELKSDKEVVMAAVKSHENSLEYASDDLKSDKEVVMAAVHSFGRALKYITSPEEIISQKAVVKKKEIRKKTKFKEEDVYVINSINTEGKNGFWVKCETWNFDDGDTYVFNRPGCFGTLQSDDGDYTGHNEVVLTCKKFKSIPEALKFDNMDIEDSEKVIFNYDDVLSNDFMMVNGIIFHQKFISKILVELNPWGYSESVNRFIFNIMEESDTSDLGFEQRRIPYCKKLECEQCKDQNYSWEVEIKECPCKNKCSYCSEAIQYKNKKGDLYIQPDFGEDVYDEEGYERGVTFKSYGRVEGTMFIGVQDGDIVFEHKGVSLDYVQVIDMFEPKF